ncbi:inhibitor of growth protein 5-like isoform X1 [Oculina patagonica]
MIGCDGLQCSIKWFHFSCAGIDNNVPEGEWLCISCRKNLRLLLLTLSCLKPWTITRFLSHLCWSLIKTFRSCIPLLYT